MFCSLGLQSSASANGSGQCVKGWWLSPEQNHLVAFIYMACVDTGAWSASPGLQLVMPVRRMFLWNVNEPIAHMARRGSAAVDSAVVDPTIMEQSGR